ncbi:uncharacterized protein P884DRAFT_78854 [Thermothelomyces heterothallicus CBS 202.75]|uniref:uncharacterized protein n=1 Tax=Thermothelomyces heterothallicus CBS 202.75 TaxID=1149848 RepID=UPI0037438724
MTGTNCLPLPGPGPGPGSRKRGRSEAETRAHDCCVHRPAKHIKREPAPHDGVVKHALLAQYYSEIQTLRQFALSKLSSSSRLRRKKIASVGRRNPASDGPPTEDELALGHLLDSTIVAHRHHDDVDRDLRWQQWVGFSQRGDESSVTLSGGLEGSIYSQSEIVDFVIWLLFSREATGSWPKHILCDGFRRQTGGPCNRPNPGAVSTVPGLYVVYPNPHVQALKLPPWPQLLMLLGKEGERIMLDMLVDCAIFKAVPAGKGNLYQLSGIPLSELEPITQVRGSKDSGPKNNGKGGAELRPSEIAFVRSRMLYARAALNARGLIHFGLRHIRMSKSLLFPTRCHTYTSRCLEPTALQRAVSRVRPRQ